MGDRNLQPKLGTRLGTPLGTGRRAGDWKLLAFWAAARSKNGGPLVWDLVLRFNIAWEVLKDRGQSQ